MGQIDNITADNTLYKTKEHIKIFFGCVSGVGKSYAMLQNVMVWTS